MMKRTLTLAICSALAVSAFAAETQGCADMAEVENNKMVVNNSE